MKQKDSWIYASISSARGKSFAIRWITNNMNETFVIWDWCFPFKWGSFEKRDRVILTSSDSTKRSCWFKINWVYWLCHSRNFTNRVSSVSWENMTKSILVWRKMNDQFCSIAKIQKKFLYFSFPSPPTMIRWLSEVQAKSLIEPEKGWNSFFNRCSLLSTPQIRTFPCASESRETKRNSFDVQKKKNWPAEAM